MYRCFIDWTGNVTGQAVTILHFEGDPGDPLEAKACADKTAAFALAIKGNLPIGVSVQARALVEEVVVSSGDLTAAYAITPTYPIQTGSGSGTYPRVAGAVINWKTAGIVESRRVRGRTFIVPMGGNQYESNGTLDGGAISGLTAAGVALFTGDPVFGIWHRPTGATPPDGSFHGVTACVVPDKAAVLRSRRD